ncbi:hypothetical protein E4U42_007767 [Claviceps africana]|uniref:NAD-dependent epimerase/dehydratase domain-containing protein n=1 Tax=Claviceps africana TaxID=83212 RepID=A0A8K0J104_9HYPO|nr:hypothetical protein E4U42_007767 [Claviceps africana]
MAAPSAAVVIGSTGLVGSLILSNIIAHDSYKPVHTITRRAPKTSSPNLNSVVDADTTKWASALPALSPPPRTLFSALGTTRAAAGGIENQWKIDHDLNVELAKAAKDAGVKTLVFISSSGTRYPGVSTLSPYAKMKNGVEDAVRELGFDHAVIVKPGMILGEREQSRLVEGILQKVVRGLGRASAGLQNAVGQEAEVIARAAIRAAQLAEEGHAPDKYWVLEASEILKLGKAEFGAGAAEEKT